MFVFFKQKTAYEMRISDWSSDVCSSDLGWRDGGVIGLDMMPNKLPAEALAAGMTPQTFLHNMGLTGGTAWIGLLRVASAKPGDTVFVSAAGGAVGSAVVQIAKAREMTEIGRARV